MKNMKELINLLICQFVQCVYLIANNVQMFLCVYYAIKAITNKMIPV